MTADSWTTLSGYVSTSATWRPGRVSTANQTPPTPEPPAVRIMPIQPQAMEEGPVPALILVVRDSAPDQALTVTYDVGGTAENESDFQPLRGSVTISEKEWFALIAVTPVDDEVEESRESVVIELTVPRAVEGAPYRVTWPGRAVAVIADNDAANRPPSVELTLPRDGSVFRGPLDLGLLARAFDSDGSVEKVEFFAGETSLGVVENETPVVDPELIVNDLQDLEALNTAENPAEFSAHDSGFVPRDSNLTIAPRSSFHLLWEDASIGRHSITAVATDDDGAATTSAPVEIEIVEDNSQPVVNIVARDPIAAEGESANGERDTATFVVHRTGSTDIALPVFYSFHGTAKNDVDFNETPTTITIPEGERTATITIIPVDDTAVEGRENVVIRLEPPACIEIVPPPADCYLVGNRKTAEAHIRDNDESNGNHPPFAQIAHPAQGSLHQSGDDVSIVAHTWDRDGRVVSVEFFADNRSLGTVNAPTPVVDATTGTADILPPFHLTWMDVPAGTYSLTAEATDNDGAKTLSRPVEIKVVETTPPPVVTIEATDAEATESVPRIVGPNDEFTPDTATLRITRTGPTAESLTVYFQVDGSATPNVDHSLRSHVARIPADESSVDIVISPWLDEKVEGDETVIITLVPPVATAFFHLPSRYIVGKPARARAVIHDADTSGENVPPLVELVSPPDGSRFREGANVTLIANARDRDGHVAKVEFFANGESLGTVNGMSPAEGDANTAGLQPESIVQPPRHLFHLVWEDVPAGAFRLTAVATDDDEATGEAESRHIRVIGSEKQIVTVEAVDPIAREGGHVTESGAIASDVNTASFVVSRKGDIDIELPVHYALGGSAKNGVDYRQLSGTVTIPAGHRSARVTVVPIDDNEVERLESVVLEIQPAICPAIFPEPPTCYLVGQPSRAAVHIHDNDLDRNQSPHIAIASPRTGSRYVAPAEIEIVAHARDADGWVTLVEFFAGERKIGESVIHFIEPPDSGQRQVFALNWPAVPEGEYRIRARATDNLGGVSESRPIEINVKPENSNQLIHIRAVDPIASETPHANGDRNTARFVISREGPTDSTIDVPFEIGGSAVQGVDYQQLHPGRAPDTHLGVVKLGEGQSSAVIEINPIDDDTPEGRETVTLKLRNPHIGCPEGATCVLAIFPAPYDLGRSKAAAVILDNDRPTDPIHPGDRDDMPAARRVDDGVVMVTLTTPHLAGAAGDAIVEASEDLVDWFPVANAAVVDGVIHFIDAEAAAKRFLFYRVVSPDENIQRATNF